MKDADRILLELKMLDEGIVPNTSHLRNVEDQLKLMTFEDARRARRKWRKLKRKACKKYPNEGYAVHHSRANEKYWVLMMLAHDRNT